MAPSAPAVQAMAATTAVLTARSGHRLADAYRIHAPRLEREIAARPGLDPLHAKAVALETWTVALRRLGTGVRVLPSGVLPWLTDLSGMVLAALVRGTTSSPSAAQPIAA